MQKLVTILLGTTTLLTGCAPEPRGAPDWRLNGGCERYFTVTSREYADCKAFVKSQEAKAGPMQQASPAPGASKSGVSLDPEGAYYTETQGEKQNYDRERTLTD